MRTQATHILLFIAGMLMTGMLFAQDLSVLDAELSRYEALCEKCLDLKVRIDAGEKVSRQEARDLVGRFVSMNASLKERRAEMTVVQRIKFDDVGVWFTTGQRPDKKWPFAQELVYVPDHPSVVTSAVPSASLRSMDGPVHRLRRWDYLDKYVLTDFSTIDLSGGFMLGLQWRMIGGYARARFRNAITGVPGTSYECHSNGPIYPSGGQFWGTGKSDTYALSVTGGLMAKATKWMTFYAGAGYGESYVVWQDVDLEWADVYDLSYHGLAMDFGVIFSWRSLAVSAGITSIVAFETLSFTCGLGVRL